ncbi:MAG: hypothetical protein CMN31_14170 [Sandaracinus sp.]|nr:hypothetical protein [Myxococcales bacterium]MAT26594.1 hypothetical protein [Sandaracinus sp.]MBJ72460.1 hypothetical protein [Sandaracinus sp.]
MTHRVMTRSGGARKPHDAPRYPPRPRAARSGCHSGPLSSRARPWRPRSNRQTATGFNFEVRGITFALNAETPLSRRSGRILTARPKSESRSPGALVGHSEAPSGAPRRSPLAVDTLVRPAGHSPAMARAPSLSRVLLPSLALAALLASSLPDRALAQEPASETTSCIDEAIRDELNARRRYRGVRERLFQKALRHELSVMGGIYSADLLSSWAQVQGAYTFHFSEALGLELSFAWTRAKSELVRIIENDRGIALLRVENDVYVYMGHLLWSLAYGKVRWFGGTISRFDFYLAVGGGITDNQTARGLTFSGGFGLKMYFGEWFALRLDVRDQVLQQEILGESEIVNNIAATFGLSIFMPFTQ